MSHFLRGVITNAYYHENNITGIGSNCHKNPNGLTFHKYMKVEACDNKNVKFVLDKICIQNVHVSHVSRPFRRHVKVVFSNNKNTSFYPPGSRSISIYMYKNVLLKWSYIVYICYSTNWNPVGSGILPVQIGIDLYWIYTSINQNSNIY